MRTAGRHTAAVRDAVAEHGRRTIRLPADRDWLVSAIARKLELSASEVDMGSLLAEMAKREHLYRVRQGSYVVAPDGTSTVQQAAPPELLVDLVLRAQGHYYISHLGAMIAHRLTDLHSSDSYATIKRSSTFRPRTVELVTGTLHICEIVDRFWPEPDALSRVRVFSGAREFAWRASLELTLVDAVARPELCAGFETAVSGWARARLRDTDWDAVARIAAGRGGATAHRVAFLLALFGLDEVVERCLPGLTGRGRRIPLDRSDSYCLDGELERDAATGVVLNVPRDLLHAWSRPPIG